MFLSGTSLGMTTEQTFYRFLKLSVFIYNLSSNQKPLRFILRRMKCIGIKAGHVTVMKVTGINTANTFAKGLCTSL